MERNLGIVLLLLYDTYGSSRVPLPVSCFETGIPEDKTRFCETLTGYGQRMVINSGRVFNSLLIRLMSVSLIVSTFNLPHHFHLIQFEHLYLFDLRVL